MPQRRRDAQALRHAARARIALNQCIRSHEACESNCFLSVQNRPPYPSYFKDCTNRCDTNHSACVDFALTLSLFSEIGRPLI